MRSQNVVLIVGDDPYVRRVIFAALSQMGCSAVEASNGHEGVERANSTRFDLAIVDRCLTDVLGNDIVPQLRLNQPDLKVLSLAPRERGSFGDRCSALRHADAYLDKPFALDDLCRAVARCLYTGFTRGTVVSAN